MLWASSFPLAKDVTRDETLGKAARRQIGHLKDRLIKLLVVVIVVGCLPLIFVQRNSGDSTRRAGDFSEWMKPKPQHDWSSKAALGDAEAQFCLGMTLISTNLQQCIDNVPYLGDVPGLGRRFRTVTYQIDPSTSADLLRTSFGWIKKSAQQAYAPAIAAQQLFAGRAQ